jgi:hypothetical protein
MKFIDFLKTPIQDSPGKTEKDFPFFPNFFHFGMKHPEIFNAEGHSPQKVLRE